MKRISTGGPVSETLMAAIEDADSIGHVLILAYHKENGQESAYYCDDNLDLATAIFMLEKLKLHLLQ